MENDLPGLRVAGGGELGSERFDLGGERLEPRTERLELATGRPATRRRTVDQRRALRPKTQRARPGRYGIAASAGSHIRKVGRRQAG